MSGAHLLSTNNRIKIYYKGEAKAYCSQKS